MPEQELPDEFIKPLLSPSNSSLSSNSSDIILINANYIRDSRSVSISSNSTNIQDDESLDINSNNINLNSIRNVRSRHVEEEEDEKYEPIKLPTEPTLEELLRQVTGKSDIATVEQVKLRIISSAISLQRLPYFMPHLRHLTLEGSLLFSLRDLGCDLTSLAYLNISRCGLKSLDGTNGLSTLIELVADHNQIEDAGPCSNLPQIRKISLKCNKIKDFHGMMFLGLCLNLNVLDLTNNGITQKENYRQIVRSHIPHLAILDQTAYEDVNDELKIELLRLDYQNVICSNQILKTVNSRIEDMNRLQFTEERPSSAQTISPQILPVTHISIGKRPTTSDGTKAKHDVSVGEAVCGSIIAKARKPKKLRTAWGDSMSSSSSSSFSSTDSSSHTTPMRSKFNERNRRNTVESTDVLLENSKNLRERSRDFRGKYKNY
ncbi:unnamed protein product [Chironomus riparius]|uniref:Leucine-rich repeat-containing protein 56 n=1 Tax=Chironomus riparius TaxID=315576 RepID=A0A9N9WSG6_9DIPT|nr:unnamed protein product [Chironomus riparius]